MTVYAAESRALARGRSSFARAGATMVVEVISKWVSPVAAAFQDA